jgi:hypothetical protein
VSGFIHRVCRGIGLFTAPGPWIEGQAIGIFELHPDPLRREAEDFANDLLTDGIVPWPDIGNTGENIDPAVSFQR